MLLLVVVNVLFALCNASKEIDVGPRVINGYDAKPGQFPYIVSLRVNGFGHFCGGSIIRPTWVLTAAHCVLPHIPDKIVVGTLHKSSNGGATYQVLNVIPHPQYSDTETVHDIALIKLARPISFSNLVKPISLANIGLNQKVTAAGWGRGSGETLKYLPMRTTQECARATLVCVKAPNAGVCNGDSGGPLVNEKDELVGLASYVQGTGKDPCNSIYPDVFTRVASYVPWIISHIRY